MRDVRRPKLTVTVNRALSHIAYIKFNFKKMPRSLVSKQVIHSMSAEGGIQNLAALPANHYDKIEKYTDFDHYK